MAENAKAPQERIVLDVAYQPQVRTKTDTRRIMLDVIIALLPAVAAAVWQFGFGVLLVIGASVGSAVFFEWGYRKLLKKSGSIDDLSAAVTGLLLALTLPPTAPWWLPVVGTLFAIVVVKQLYGGIGKNFLNPALAGRAFLLASYALLMGQYSVPNSLVGAVDGITMATPLSYLYGDTPLPVYLSYDNLFLGITPGAIGEISTAALLIGGLYLIARRVISWRIPVSFIGTVALLTLIFGRNGDHFGFMLGNLLSGGLFLGAIFMATDYATSPVTLKGQLLYGFGCGALTVLIRYFGGFPEGVSYAILIMNLCAWAIDKGFRRYPFGTDKEAIQADKAARKAKKEAAK
ncbi:MAG: RnfABCDGE type electron transport complex subunit D [Oscillospiraceae bacterium]|nr:RnfABCDGE type electron transport complex subunit D [Oscillospiraceae bacterium]